jgi:hypothetical protein
MTVIRRRDGSDRPEWASIELRVCGDCGWYSADKRDCPGCGVEGVPVTYTRGAVALADAAEKFLADMDALENSRPASSWFALKEALRAFRGGQ